MSGPRDAIRLQSMRAHERAQIAEARLAAAEAREKTLREAVRHVVNDSPGTPESVKGYLRDALAASEPA